MTRASVALGAIAIVLILLAVVVEYRTPDRRPTPAPPSPPRTAAIAPPPAAEAHPSAQTHQGFLYGRVTAVDGSTYTGRLRWGRDQEAFWNDYFNGARRKDPWLAHVPPELVPEERRPGISWA